MQGPHHHPGITRHADGRWLIRCPEYEANESALIPIGIAMPLESLQVTELILANHVRREGQRSHQKSARAR